MFDKVFKEHAQTAVAVFDSYSMPLASTARNTLRGSFSSGLGHVELDLPDSDAGRAVRAAAEDSGVIVRPFIADIQSEILDDTEVIRGGRLRALIVSPTDSRAGWPEPEIVGPDTPAPRRRARLWL